MELYTQSGVAKLPGIIEYIEGLLKENKKFLVYAHHQEVMNGLEEFVKSAVTSIFFVFNDNFFFEGS